MLKKYSTVSEYEDTGEARYIPAQGAPFVTDFVTRFSRDGGLRFEFSEPKIAYPEERRRGWLTADGHRADFFVDGYTQKKTTSIEEGTGTLQGTTYLGSVLVPRLVYGLLFCTCDPPAEIASEGTEMMDGRPAARLRLVSRSGSTFTLWIDEENSLLRRVEVRSPSAEAGAARIVVQYGVQRAK